MIKKIKKSKELKEFQKDTIQFLGLLTYLTINALISTEKNLTRWGQNEIYDILSLGFLILFGIWLYKRIKKENTLIKQSNKKR